MGLNHLTESLKNASVIDRGEYNYFIHPITDGIPRIEPDLLMEVCVGLEEILELDADYIVTMESMGIHIASVLSQLTGLPVNIIRKKQYWLKDEVVLDQSTGYGGGTLYMNGINEGDRVVIVDAVVSTGGTLKAVLKGMKERKAEVVDVAGVIGRGKKKKKVKKQTGVEVKTLVDIEVGEKVKIIHQGLKD